MTDAAEPMPQGRGANPWTCLCHDAEHPVPSLAARCETRTEAGDTPPCCAGRLPTGRACG